MAFKATKGQGSFRIEVEPYALKNLISTLNLLDKETQGRVRDAAQPLSKRLAGQLTQFGQSSPTPQTKLVLQSMLTPRDRLIRVDLGGDKKVGRPYGGTASKSGKGNKVGRSAAPARRSVPPRAAPQHAGRGCHPAAPPASGHWR